jgi:hypothetical protein
MPTSRARARARAKAERAICEEGALLVYPEAGRVEPRSLWHVLWFQDLWDEASVLIDCAPGPCTSIFPAQSPWQNSVERMRKR